MASSISVVLRSCKAAGLFGERTRPRKRHFASINITGKGEKIFMLELKPEPRYKHSRSLR
jgi:hypothetical protein